MSNLDFNFNGQPIRIRLIDNEPWFLGADVCRVLEIKNYSDAYTRLRNYEKTLTKTEGVDNPNSVYISESGLYRLVLTSRKPQAEAFQDWVVQEVIPSIRKTGSYSTQPQVLSTAQMFLQAAQVLAEHEQLLKQQDLRLQAIESRFVGIEADIAELPEPPEKVPAKSLRAALNQLVKGYAYHNKTGYPEAWRRLYSEYLSLYSIDLKARSKKLQCSTVEYAEHTGHLNTLYSVAHQLFTPRILASKPIYTEAV